MDKKRTLIIFSLAFIIPIIFFRIFVFLLCAEDYCPIAQSITGLTIHHFHFGMLLLLIAILLLVFFKKNDYTIGLTGLGLGITLDQFVPSLLLQTGRAEEVAVYFDSLFGTIILAVLVIALSIIIYFINSDKK